MKLGDFVVYVPIKNYTKFGAEIFIFFKIMTNLLLSGFICYALYSRVEAEKAFYGEEGGDIRC